MKLKVFTAFSGYDSQCMALDRLGIDYELVGWSEIDKFAIQAHNAVYPQWADRNFGDISKIDWNEVPDFDLFTYSFPCTDISNAGQQKGLEKGSGTRSSLLWECQKAIEIKRPKYCLMENVAALVSEKFLPYFLEWERLMCRYGYDNYNRILDSKDYGIPQHRERIFMVSIQDEGRSFYWPENIELVKRLKDVLEIKVDEKYYLSEDKIANLIERETDKKGNREEPRICTMVGRDPMNPKSRKKSENYQQFIEIGDDVCNTLTTVQKDNLVYEPQVLTPKRTDFGKSVRKQDEKGELKISRHKMTKLEPRKDGICNALTTVQKDNLLYEPIIQAKTETLKIKQATKQGFVEIMPGSLFDASYPESKTRRGRVQDGGQTSPTLTAGGESPCLYEEGSFRIRYLTPKECFRLMGVCDSDIQKIQENGLSNRQQLKMAGNSIVVEVLVQIFRKMFVVTGQETQQLMLF